MHAAVFGLDVLKIDVEGAELRVVLGMRALLESGPAVVVELHAPDLPAGSPTFFVSGGIAVS